MGKGHPSKIVGFCVRNNVPVRVYDCCINVGGKPWDFVANSPRVRSKICSNCEFYKRTREKHS